MDRGWIEAANLAAGDVLLTKEGGYVGVESCEDTGEFEVVYNLRVAEWHTYFVGDEGWDWGVWSHNAAYTVDYSKKGLEAIQSQHPGLNKDALIKAGYTKKQANSIRSAARKEGLLPPTAGKTRGPKTEDTAAHNAMIKDAAERIERGEALPDGRVLPKGRVIAGGRVLKEARIPTPGGEKATRRPDILVETPDGKVYGVNVGLMEDSGVPIERERGAMADLLNTGKHQGRSLKMYFLGYGYESDFDP